jgi:hypothetical protein
VKLKVKSELIKALSQPKGVKLLTVYCLVPDASCLFNRTGGMNSAENIPWRFNGSGFEVGEEPVSCFIPEFVFILYKDFSLLHFSKTGSTIL